MKAFLSSLKQESECYKNTAISIDRKQRDLSIRFDELETNANRQIFGKRRPQPVSARRAFKCSRKNGEIDNSSEKNDIKNSSYRGNFNWSRPQTARADSRRNKQNKTIWVTGDTPATARVPNQRKEFYANVCFPNKYGSHHFGSIDDTLPEREPRTPRNWKTPVCVRRMMRTLSEEEKIYSDKPDVPDAPF